MFWKLRKGSKVKGQSKNLSAYDKKEKKICEPFFKVMKVEKVKRANKDTSEIFCPFKRGTSLCDVLLRWSVDWGRGG